MWKLCDVGQLVIAVVWTFHDYFLGWLFNLAIRKIVLYWGRQCNVVRERERVGCGRNYFRQQNYFYRRHPWILLRVKLNYLHSGEWNGKILLLWRRHHEKPSEEWRLFFWDDENVSIILKIEFWWNCVCRRDCISSISLFAITTKANCWFMLQVLSRWRWLRI